MRPLTEPERRYLQWHRVPAADSLKALAQGSGVASGCLSVPILFVVAVTAKVMRVELMTHNGALLLTAVPALTWAAIFTLTLSGRRKRALQRAEWRRRIDADLAGGVAHLRRFRATEILLAWGDGRASRNYFVRLDSGKILFLGGWKPPTCDLREGIFSPDERGFPSAEFEIAVGPESQLILDVVGTGEYLRPGDEFDLALGSHGPRVPSTLESGSYVDERWENLRKVYG